MCYQRPMSNDLGKTLYCKGWYVVRLKRHQINFLATAGLIRHTKICLTTDSIIFWYKTMKAIHMVSHTLIKIIIRLVISYSTLGNYLIQTFGKVVLFRVQCSLANMRV